MNTYYPNPQRVEYINSLWNNEFASIQEKYVKRYRSLYENSCIILRVDPTDSLDMNGQQYPILSLHIENTYTFFLYFVNLKLFSTLVNANNRAMIKSNCLSLLKCNKTQKITTAYKFVSIRIK